VKNKKTSSKIRDKIDFGIFDFSNRCYYSLRLFIYESSEKIVPENELPLISKSSKNNYKTNG
jgi:hypothetical protein